MLTRLPITRLRLSEGKWWRKTGLPTITVRLCPYQTQSPGHPAGGAHVQTLRGTCASQAGSRGADPWWLRSSSSSQRFLQTLFDGDDYYYIWLYYIWFILTFIFNQMWKLRVGVVLFFFNYLLRAIYLKNKWQHFNPGRHCTLVCPMKSWMRSLNQERDTIIQGWQNQRVHWNFTGSFMTGSIAQNKCLFLFLPLHEICLQWQ